MGLCNAASGAPHYTWCDREPHADKMHTGTSDGERVQWKGDHAERVDDEPMHSWSQIMPPLGAKLVIVADADGHRERYTLDAVIYGESGPEAIRVLDGSEFLLVPWCSIRSLGWAP